MPVKARRGADAARSPALRWQGVVAVALLLAACAGWGDGAPHRLRLDRSRRFTDRRVRGGRCPGRRGEKVRVLDLPGVGHMTAAQVSANAAVECIGARFAGTAPPDDCAQRVSPIK